MGFTSFTTGAVVGTYTQLPSQLCDEVVISGGLANAITIGGAASPGTAILTVPASVTPGTIKTGGNLNNLWMSPTTAAAITVGLMWVRYLPIVS